MENFLITVQIADREYRLKVDRKKEELVRIAVSNINDDIKKYADNYEFKDKQDLLSMVVLQNAISTIELEEQVSFQQNQLNGKLEEIDRVLSDEPSV